jgi:hypothetical protein
MGVNYNHPSNLIPIEPKETLGTQNFSVFDGLAGKPSVDILLLATSEESTIKKRFTLYQTIDRRRNLELKVNDILSMALVFPILDSLDFVSNES